MKRVVLRSPRSLACIITARDRRQVRRLLNALYEPPAVGHARDPRHRLKPRLTIARPTGRAIGDY